MMAMKSLKVHTRHEGRKEEGMALGEPGSLREGRSRSTSAFDRRARAGRLRSSRPRHL